MVLITYPAQINYIQKKLIKVIIPKYFIMINSSKLLMKTQIPGDREKMVVESEDLRLTQTHKYNYMTFISS